MTVKPPLTGAEGPPSPTPAPKEAPRGSSLGRRIRLGLGWGLLCVAVWLGVSWLL